MAISLDFGQVWPSFAGCYFANTVSAPFSMIDGDDPGCPSPRPLRGFRRRWTDLGPLQLLHMWVPQNRILMQMQIYQSFLHLEWTCLESLVVQIALTAGRLSMKVWQGQVLICMSLSHL